MKVTAPAKADTFPEVAIRKSIREFWNEKADEQADNPFAPERENTLYGVLPHIDSLAIMDFILRIEEIIDIEIPPKVIKRGGYESCDEMTQHLLPQLRELHAKGR